jgi:pyruvate-formate lyase-activating enzyme
MATQPVAPPTPIAPLTFRTGPDVPRTDEGETLSADEWAAFARRQRELAAALHEAQVSTFYYNIEVAGTCNLRCPSCAVGNTAVAGPPKALMTMDLFASILRKIRIEQAAQNRSAICLDLYNWGEPLLNPALPAMITHAKREGFKVGISTNLNHGVALDDTVRSGPSYIRVSLSGFSQAIYARTHKGGNIELVKANLRRLRALIDRSAVDTIVQVGYISYRHNGGEELERMAALCHRLDFTFSRDVAALMPLEKLLTAIETGVVPADIEGLLAVEPRRMADLSRPFRAEFPDCSLRRARMTINADGSVPLCCAVWSREYDVAPNYLEIQESDIQAARYAHHLCDRCQSGMADFTYNGVYVTPVLEEVGRALGPSPTGP